MEGPASCNNELSVNEGVQAEARGLLLGMWQRLGRAASELWFCAGGAFSTLSPTVGIMTITNTYMVLSRVQGLSHTPWLTQSLANPFPEPLSDWSKAPVQ